MDKLQLLQSASPRGVVTFLGRRMSGHQGNDPKSISQLIEDFALITNNEQLLVLSHALFIFSNMIVLQELK